ncbi:MAG: hypothetical protein DHS20C11_15460 [Lysobacteraceae bacterium]|nr:MAG: hypothetical protein DHS20C11_15460 [Xanthomonadaceae bacterium]
MSHPSIINRLIIKDIRLNAVPLGLYFIVGLIGLGLLTVESKGPFYAGSVILLSMIIVAGAHLVTVTVNTERSDQTLAFILSLPITFNQYSHAKVCANLMTFLGFWLLLYLGMVMVIYSQAAIPNGLLVYATILMLELFAVFVLVLSVGLISESQNWTIVVMSITNICLSMFMFWLSSIEGIRANIEAAAPVWNAAALQIVAAEFAFVLACLAITYWLQSRKRDFL